jgi:guanylate kinase
MEKDVQQPEQRVQHTRYKMIVVSGASGAGKTTLLHMIERDLGIPLTYLPSYTTREKRESDERGMRCVSVEAFTRMEEGGEFLWTKHVHGNHYGTRKEDVASVKTASSLTATILTPDRLPHLHNTRATRRINARCAFYAYTLSWRRDITSAS